MIAYVIEDGKVALLKVPAKPRSGMPIDDPFACFREWDTSEDEEAFADLQEWTR